MEQTQKPLSKEQNAKSDKPTQRANESAGLNIDEFVRITDPNTQEVHLEKRA